MNQIDLSGPDYFTCERYRCRMLRSDCVARQKAVPKRVNGEYWGGYPECTDCGQGREIMENTKAGNVAIKPESGAIVPGTREPKTVKVEAVTLQEPESGAAESEITLGGVQIREPEMAKVEEGFSGDPEGAADELMGAEKMKTTKDEIGEGKKEAEKKSNTRRGTCANCKRVNKIIIAQGLDYICWKAAKGLTDEAREKALLEVKERVDSGSLRVGVGNKNGRPKKQKSHELSEAIPGILLQASDPQTCIPITIRLTVEIAVKVTGIAA